MERPRLFSLVVWSLLVYNTIESRLCRMEFRNVKLYVKSWIVCILEDV
jgi:hypothetical protein